MRDINNKQLVISGQTKLVALGLTVAEAKNQTRNQRSQSICNVASLSVHTLCCVYNSSMTQLAASGGRRLALTFKMPTLDCPSTSKPESRLEVESSVYCYKFSSVHLKPCMNGICTVESAVESGGHFDLALKLISEVDQRIHHDLASKTSVSFSCSIC